jgi:hypothetical protein
MILRQRRLLEDQANIIRDLRRQLEAAGCGFAASGGGGCGIISDGEGLNKAAVDALEADALAKVCDERFFGIFFARLQSLWRI